MKDYSRESFFCGRLLRSSWLLTLLFFCNAEASAYIGPGGGLSAIGALLALLAAIFVAVLGFLWYPIKRLLGMRRSSRQRGSESIESDGGKKEK